MKMFIILFVHALYVIELQKQAAPAHSWEMDVADRNLQMYCETLKKSDDKAEGGVFFLLIFVLLGDNQGFSVYFVFVF